MMKSSGSVENYGSRLTLAERMAAAASLPVTVSTQASSAPPEQAVSLFSQTKSFAEAQWNKASSLLHNHPNLMTPHILNLALKHRPPTDVIQFMLELNPAAASLPKSGPSALQIAIQSLCSVDVVEAVIIACPLALVATNPDSSHLDPLSYAKRFRSNEFDLIKTLSRPLPYWISRHEEAKKTAIAQSSTLVDESPPDLMVSASYGVKRKDAVVLPAHGFLASAANATAATVPPVANSRSCKSVHQSNFYRTAASARNLLDKFDSLNFKSGWKTNSASQATFTGPPLSVAPSQRPTQPLQLTVGDRQEIDNLKHLCASLLKGHRKVAKELSVLSSHHEEIEKQKKEAEELEQKADETTSTTSIPLSLRHYSVEEERKRTAKIVLLALDMKERAFRGHLKRTQDTCLKSVRRFQHEHEHRLTQRHGAILKLVQEHVSSLQSQVEEVAKEQRREQKRRLHVSARQQEEQKRTAAIMTDLEEHRTANWRMGNAADRLNTTYSTILTSDTENCSVGSSPYSHFDKTRNTWKEPSARYSKRYKKNVSGMFLLDDNDTRGRENRIVFASPSVLQIDQANENDDEDDVRSLLTEDSLATRRRSGNPSAATTSGGGRWKPISKLRCTRTFVLLSMKDSNIHEG